MAKNQRYYLVSIILSLNLETNANFVFRIGQICLSPPLQIFAGFVGVAQGKVPAVQFLTASFTPTVGFIITIKAFQVDMDIRLGCASLLNRRIPDDKMNGFVDAKEYDKEICDEFIRVPDYICGSLASMDFNNVEEIPDKHYVLFDKSIVDNERIFIMNIKHGVNEDTLSDLKFTRS